MSNYQKFKNLEMLEFLNKQGLTIDVASGGHWSSDYDAVTFNTIDSDVYEMNTPDGNNIVFQHPDIFLKAISVSENALQVRLFN